MDGPVMIKSRAWMKRAVAISAMAMLALPGAADAQKVKKVPYWASLSEAEARMRVGPSFDYPSSWIYRRRDLPVKVVQTLSNWRKVEDSTGTQGWMHVRLLSDRATAIVIGAGADLRSAANEGASLLFHAEPGVVGRTSDCGNGWCMFDVRGQRGYARVQELWGATGN